MDSPKTQFWFPVKRYGWGWGIPVCWQGWVVLAGYFGAILLLARYFRVRDDVAGFLIGVAVCSAILLAIVTWKGEKPLRWRWGK